MRTLTQKECRSLKTKLTRAINSKNAVKIIETVDAAFAHFEAAGIWPDTWRLWESAKRTAETDKRINWRKYLPEKRRSKWLG